MVKLGLLLRLIPSHRDTEFAGGGIFHYTYVNFDVSELLPSARPYA